MQARQKDLHDGSAVLPEGSGRGAAPTRRRFLIGLSALGVTGSIGSILASCVQAAPSTTGAATGAAGPKVIVRFGHHHPPNGQVDRYAQNFAQLVSNKSNGQAEVQIFPSGQLGAEGDAVKGVQLGTLQMTVGGDSFLTDYVNELGTESLPFIFDGWAHGKRAMEGPLGAELGKRLVEKSNVRALSWPTLGFRHMFFGDAHVTKIAGMKGLKMRAPQVDLFVRMFELVGAKPVTITFSEVYTALQTGVVAGVEVPAQTMLDAKLAEITKFGLLTGHIFNSFTHMVNKTFFDSLPKNIQTALLDAAAEATKALNLVAEQDEGTAVASLKQKGMTIETLADAPAWKTAMQPLIDDWVKARPGAASLLDIVKKTA